MFMKWQIAYVLMQILDGQFWPIKITFLSIHKFRYDPEFSSYNNVSQLYVKGWIIKHNVVTQLNFASDHLKNSPWTDSSQFSIQKKGFKSRRGRWNPC